MDLVCHDGPWGAGGRLAAAIGENQKRVLGSCLGHQGVYEFGIPRHLTVGERVAAPLGGGEGFSGQNAGDMNLNLISRAGGQVADPAQAEDPHGALGF